MALILNIDTTTALCSVVLARDGEKVVMRENNEGLNHSLLLGEYVDEILKEQHIEVADLDAVAVSMGPGSYTGLRIGVSLAKGLCFGASRPLIAINTLQAMSQAVSAQVMDESAFYCPMLDARRMEVYMALYDVNNTEMMATCSKVIDSKSFSEKLIERKIYFFGNGSDKVEGLIAHSNAMFIRGVETSARNMMKLAEAAYQANCFEDVAYFEPYYLKEFMTTTPKHKVL